MNSKLDRIEDTSITDNSEIEGPSFNEKRYTDEYNQMLIDFCDEIKIDDTLNIDKNCKDNLAKNQYTEMR